MLLVLIVLGQYLLWVQVQYFLQWHSFESCVIFAILFVYFDLVYNYLGMLILDLLLEYLGLSKHLAENIAGEKV